MAREEDDRARQGLTPQAYRGRARRAWIKAYGPIPGREWHVHHKDGDFTNNDLSNLELVHQAQHLRSHYVAREPERKTCVACGAVFGSARRQQRDRYCSNSCKTRYRLREGVDNEVRVCVVCGEKFTINRYTKTVCCSRKCGSSLSAERRRGKPQPKRKP